jgi:hypothetical protein
VYFEIPHHLHRQLALVISELKHTVGWKATKAYLYRVSHAEESTGSGSIIADVSSHTSDTQGAIGKVSDAVKETSMTRLNEDRRIGAIKAHRDLITPLLTDPNPDALLAPSFVRISGADAWDSPPGAEARSSSPATEIINMALCERCECRRCKQRAARANNRPFEGSFDNVIQNLLGRHYF